VRDHPDAQGMQNGPLRFPDEFVRHKVLDLIGDLALAGRRIQGRVIAERAGHAMHTALVQRLLRDRSAWELATATMRLPRRGSDSIRPGYIRACVSRSMRSPRDNGPVPVKRVAAIALGSNLASEWGDRPPRTCARRLRAQARLGQVRAVSSFYETDPVGFTEQPSF
jgi:hypothetical protein